MSLRRVKLYGGHAHGEIVRVDQVPTRIGTVGPRREQPNYMREARIEDLMQPIQQVSYHIEPWHMEGVNPKRFKVLYIGVIEGCNLLPHEERDLQYDMEELPWSFPPVSFLHEFEEWWSQTLYKHTGRLTWRNEPVYW